MNKQFSIRDIILHIPTGEFGTIDGIYYYPSPTISFHTNPLRGIARQRRVATADCVYVACVWVDVWDRLAALGIEDVRCKKTTRATEGAFTGKRIFYRPTRLDFVTDGDVFAQEGEWLIVGEGRRRSLIHLSQVDSIITRHNDPDARFENLSWNDDVAGFRDAKPSEVI